MPQGLLLTCNIWKLLRSHLLTCFPSIVDHLMKCLLDLLLICLLSYCCYLFTAASACTWIVERRLNKDEVGSRMHQVTWGLINQKHILKYSPVVILSKWKLVSFVKGNVKQCLLGSFFSIGLNINSGSISVQWSAVLYSDIRINCLDKCVRLRKKWYFK